MKKNRSAIIVVFILLALFLAIGTARSLEMKEGEKIYLSLVNSTDGTAQTGEACTIGILDSQNTPFVNGTAMTDENDGKYSYNISSYLTFSYDPYLATVNCTYGSDTWRSFKQFYYLKSEPRFREKQEVLAQQDNTSDLNVSITGAIDYVESTNNSLGYVLEKEFAEANITRGLILEYLTDPTIGLSAIKLYLVNTVYNYLSTTIEPLIADVWNGTIAYNESFKNLEDDVYNIDERLNASHGEGTWVGVGNTTGAVCVIVEDKTGYNLTQQQYYDFEEQLNTSHGTGLWDVAAGITSEDLNTSLLDINDTIVQQTELANETRAEIQAGIEVIDALTSEDLNISLKAQAQEDNNTRGLILEYLTDPTIGLSAIKLYLVNTVYNYLSTTIEPLIADVWNGTIAYATDFIPVHEAIESNFTALNQTTGPTLTLLDNQPRDSWATQTNISNLNATIVAIGYNETKGALCVWGLNTTSEQCDNIPRYIQGMEP